MNLIKLETKIVGMLGDGKYNYFFTKVFFFSKSHVADAESHQDLSLEYGMLGLHFSELQVGNSIFGRLTTSVRENKGFELLYLDCIRGGRGGEISRAKTRETINYFIVKFITINEKVLIKPNFAGINFKDISSHF